jgi:protein TonB
VLDASKKCKPPEYPQDAMGSGESGTVMLTFIVGVDGTVQHSEISQSSGYRDLDHAALRSMSTCKFTPGTIDGVPQAMPTKLRFSFQPQ